jgi:hypothetical protein
MSSEAPFVFILGMHRSGTSCLAGALERCGLYLGDVRRTGRFNARGYYELSQVQHIHDQILGLNRGAWHCPPLEVQVHPHHSALLADIANGLARRRPCGVKDPRLLLLLDAWTRLAPPPHCLAGTFRHPLAVAKSLLERNAIPLEDGLRLWLDYNTRLVQWHTRDPFPLIAYSLVEVEDYCQRVARLAASLGLKPQLARVRRFISSELEHHALADESVPAECQPVYHYLRENAW